MGNNAPKIRVPLRSRVGTTLIWNIDPLSSEERGQYIVEVRLGEDEQWFIPKTVRPTMQGNLGSLMDGNTDAIMIPHTVTGRINAETPFEARISFGVHKSTVSTVQIQPQSGYVPFVKAKRIELAPNNVIFAQPVYLVSVESNVIDQIAARVVQRMGESKT